jgi:hypothetical protein
MLKISRNDKRFSRLKNPTLSDVNILERYDLQEYIFNSPEAFCEELGQDLMIIGKEVPASTTVADRIDLLAVDRDGALVILELKRGNDKLQLLQAVAYAGMVAKWSQDELRRWVGNRSESVNSFVSADDNINHSQRIILVAEAFDYEVLVGAEWLYDNYEVDISCVRVTTAVDKSSAAEYLNFTQIFPAPELDEIAKKRASRNSGPVAPAFATWDEALSSATNPAVIGFFKHHLDTEAPDKLKYREVSFSISTKRRYSVFLRRDYARAAQYGRFTDDVSFWRARLSTPDSVRVGTKVNEGDRVRFQLITQADFDAFMKAVEEELQAIKWDSAYPSESRIIIDGTSESHRAFPPDWMQGDVASQAQPDVLEMELTDEHGEPLTSTVKPSSSTK